MPATKSLRKVLHVGCGVSTLKNAPLGFQDGTWEEVRFDIEPKVKPDILGTITDMSNVASGSVDAVYSSHNIEHVYSHEVLGTLSEFKRVLKDDGFLALACPDLQAVAKHMLEGKLHQPLYKSISGEISPLDILYGHRASVRAGGTYMAHKTGFSISTLLDYVRAAQFASLAGKRGGRKFEMWVIATKTQRTEPEMRQLMQDFSF